MLKKILVSSFALAAATAFGQSMNLVANNTAVTSGADSATFQRNITHFTFDLQGNTEGADWTGSEVSVDVVGTGSIWHATDQRIAEGSPPDDPNTLCYLHNLNVPALAFNATNNANTKMYDTWFTAPGARFQVDPAFASPGLPAPDTMSCQPIPPIVSTATRLRGLNSDGDEIPLAWFDTATAALNNTTLARLTFQVPADMAGIEVDDLNDATPAPTGMQLLASIRGRTTTNLNADGVAFAFDFYQIPEPSALALLALGGLAGLIRRR